MNICRKCGFEFEGGFCPKCGKDSVETLFDLCLSDVSIQSDSEDYAAVSWLEWSKNLKFELDDSGYMVKGIGGCKDEILNIPPENKKTPVTKISVWAFHNCKNIHKAVIPEGVKSIGAFAFYACGALEDVTLPKSLTKIGGSAFEGCLSLRRVYFMGDNMDWSKISMGSYNDEIVSAEKFFYSEKRPQKDGSFWHYKHGVPDAW
ncbi:MAG: leucine-rich repeat domain-containing protein [Clostridia bacterium]|nr:leucine-rich repeat domain-containing protein [Clostridia bacterium]